MTALVRPLFLLTPTLVLSLGLYACNRPAPGAKDPAAAPTTGPVAPELSVETDSPPPAPPSLAAPKPAATPKPAAPAATPKPTTRTAPTASVPAPPPVRSTDPRWDVSRTRDGATATLADGRGPLLRIVCSSGPARLRVDAPTLSSGRPPRLVLALGSNRIVLAASAGPRGVAGMGAIPPNIAARILRASTIEVQYGSQVAGPFAPPRGANAMTLANACEEAVSPAPPTPAPPLPGPGRREQIPVNFRGEWNARLEDCGTGRNDSRLIVDARTVRFYESRGEVTSVTRDGPRAISVEARYRGEGETRDRTTRMTLSGDSSRLTVGGLTRLRCPMGAADDQPRPRRDR